MGEDIPLDPATLVRIGVVTQVDLGAARAIVRIGDPQEGEIESDWVPWAAARMGRLRIWSPPAVGEQVLLFCPDGEIGAGIIWGSIARDMFALPGNSAADVMEWEDGTRISYDPEAPSLSITLAAGTLAITAPGGVMIDGDVTVTGRVTAQDDVIGGGKSLKGHRHSRVAAGSALSGPPE